MVRELILRPKSTVLEEKMTLNNRSDVRHRFYWWNNAGIRVWDDSRIVYPMRFTAWHGFTEIEPWPIKDGHDFSIIHNHTRGQVSNLFMAAAKPSWEFGILTRIQEPRIMPITPPASCEENLVWGTDADGMDWRKALSDHNSAYVEVQGGLFRNQETYAFLEPRQTLQFSEYWMPVREIGGISRANLVGVASLVRRNRSLIAGFNANQTIPGATISISNGNQQVSQEKTNLAPERTWTHEVPSAGSQAKYTLEIKDAKGVVLLRQTELFNWTAESEVKVGPQPEYHIPGPDQRSFDDWMQAGEEDELNGRVLRAVDIYKETLRRFPDSFLTQAAGRLATSLLRFDEAKAIWNRATLATLPTPRFPTTWGLPMTAWAKSSTRRRLMNRPCACRNFVPPRRSD